MVSGVEGPRPASEISRSDAPARSRAVSNSGNHPQGTDSVQLSSRPVPARSRLGELKSALQSGQYAPTPDEIASGLVRHLSQEG